MSKTLTLSQIEKELKKLEYLSQTERGLVMEELKGQADFGGITSLELLAVIRKLRSELRISEVDEEDLKNLAASMDAE